MLRTLIPAIALVALAFSGRVMQPEPQAPAEGHAWLAVDGHEYIGATRCRTCHRKEEDGAQFAKWEASKHAGAWATLATDKAKEIGAGLGIADPQQADACLKCHTTGHGATEFGSRYSVEEGVTCEACHGAGGDYYKKGDMEAIAAGTVDAAALGYVTADEATCVTCHNEESPTFDGFDYEASLAEIAHPNPNNG